MDAGDGDTTQTRRVMEAAEMRRCSRAATIHTRRSLTRAGSHRDGSDSGKGRRRSARVPHTGRIRCSTLGDDLNLGVCSWQLWSIDSAALLGAKGTLARQSRSDCECVFDK